MLVHDHAAPAFAELALHLENAFALEHHRKDEGGRRVTFVATFQKRPQQRFRVVLPDRLGRARRRGNVGADPMGNEIRARDDLRALCFPRLGAEIHALEPVLRGHQDGMVRLALGERVPTRLAAMGARLNVPL